MFFFLFLHVFSSFAGHNDCIDCCFECSEALFAVIFMIANSICYCKASHCCFVDSKLFKDESDYCIFYIWMSDYIMR